MSVFQDRVMTTVRCELCLSSREQEISGYVNPTLAYCSDTQWKVAVVGLSPLKMAMEKALRITFDPVSSFLAASGQLLPVSS